MNTTTMCVVLRCCVLFQQISYSGFNNE